MRFLIAIIALLSISAVATPKTINVPGDYPTIQEAIDAATGGDTVLVHPGTYVENIDFKGKAITVKGNQGPNTVIIDGRSPKQPDIGSVVLFNNSEGADSVLDGFTLTNGTGTLNIYGTYDGGGIYCFQSSPIIVNNIISGNLISDHGAGIYMEESEAEVKYNDIKNNSCWHGGGICFYKSTPTIIGNFIHDNHVKAQGGGIIVWNSQANITNNTIHSNLAGSGGGIDGSQASGSIWNNIIYDNSVVYYGAGIRFSNSTVNIANNTIVYNQAPLNNWGGGIDCEGYSSVTVNNTILWGNESPVGPEIYIDSWSTLLIDYSDVQGGLDSAEVDSKSTLIWGDFMIDSDPLFVDPVNADYHLTFNSPCRASGDNSAVLDLYDFEGDPRITYGTVDMGADEFYTHLYYTGDGTPGGNVEVKFVGLPGTVPVGLCIGTGILESPIPSIWGDWYLQFPIIGPIDMGKIPSPDGVLILTSYIPSSSPPPYSIPMQALIGGELSNLSVLEIK